MSERRNPLHVLLKLPFVYRLVQNGLGTEKGQTYIWQKFVESEPGQKILDLGCGPGQARPHLANDINYTGVDFNQRHIDTARVLYPNDRFIHGDLRVLSLDDSGRYDIVMMMGVLHHLDDTQARAVLGRIPELLKPTGYFCAVDPVFVPRSHPIAYLAARFDQGRNVRYAGGYTELARPYFSEVESAVRSDLLSIPYSHHLLKCRIS